LVEKQMAGNSIGLVATMGALHDGHMALIKASRSQNQITVCSVYVNPTQFNSASDLENYPRTFQEDSALLSASGCEVLFVPENSEMYNGQSRIEFNFGDLDKVMEGKFRPGHFNGVALVVSKLLHIIGPDRAYFGQKDWQQCCIIQHLVEELKFNVEVCVVRTVREKSGLALSSRNFRLNERQRATASCIQEALSEARDLLLSGENVGRVKEQVAGKLAREEDIRLEYFELANSSNLNLLDHVDDSAKPILCIAAFVGDVRLIDNMFLFNN
jgi:pantoate--beta-alanine ligase